MFSRDIPLKMKVDAKFWTIQERKSVVELDESCKSDRVARLNEVFRTAEYEFFLELFRDIIYELDYRYLEILQSGKCVFMTDAAKESDFDNPDVLLCEEMVN